MYYWMDGAYVTDDIRTETCGNAASLIAPIATVRQALCMARQRAFHQVPWLDCRWPGYGHGRLSLMRTLKIYLTASAEERAKRRYKQLKEKGISANLRGLSAAIAERDERDSTRVLASPSKTCGRCDCY